MRGLRRAFHGRGGGESFCEDVAQESLLRILDKINLFSGRSKFTTWALSVAIRVGTSQMRRKLYKDVSLNSLESDDNLHMQWADNDAVSAEQKMEQQNLVQALKVAVGSALTDRQRQAMEALMQGVPVEEIAARTNSNRNAVYKLVHDARARLKQQLESTGYTADDVVSAFA